MKRILLALGLAAALVAAAQSPAPMQNPSSPGLSNNLRGAGAIDAEPKTPLMPKTVNDDKRPMRNYAMQPPIIPHQIDNYQVDRNFNKCLSCHARERIADSQAPMVSVTHFLDRDGVVKDKISTRRYFCTQCHVPQADVRPPVASTFQDSATVEASLAKGAKK